MSISETWYTSVSHTVRVIRRRQINPKVREQTIQFRLLRKCRWLLKIMRRDGDHQFSMIVANNDGAVSVCIG